MNKRIDTSQKIKTLTRQSEIKISLEEYIQFILDGLVENDMILIPNISPIGDLVPAIELESTDRREIIAFSFLGSNSNLYALHKNTLGLYRINKKELFDIFQNAYANYDEFEVIDFSDMYQYDGCSDMIREALTEVTTEFQIQIIESEVK